MYIEFAKKIIMKKLTLLLVAVACLCSGNANAQDGKGSINFVPYVGVNYSDFSGDSDSYFGWPGTSGKVNFMAGARFEFQVADKSALIIDANYRRLGATTDNIILWYTFVDSYYSAGEARGDYNKEEILEKVKEHQGIAAESTRVTLDCISLALQFKQNIISGLSARVGLEGTGNLSKKWHYHCYNYYYYKETGKCNEYDETSDADDVFHDKDFFTAAIPLGLTYDYKNFSFNATYHLPLTNCAKQDGYSIRHQAFDLTVGYRLPLRKR